MATDWKMCLQCDSSQTSNQFTAQSNLWVSRAQGETTWNPVTTGAPQAVVNDDLYIEVNDAAGNPVSGRLRGYLISSIKEGVDDQTEVTPFRKGNNSNKPKTCVQDDDVSKQNGVWTWGPYTALQAGQFELTFAALVKEPGSEQSDSWEEDPEFDVTDAP